MSRCYKQLLLGIALFLFLILAAPLPVWSQNTAVVLQVAPSTAEIGVDEIIDVAVEVRDVSGLYGFDITVGYDPAVVEVVDFDPDLEGIQVALGLFLDPGFVIFNQADNSLGQLRLVMTQLNPSEAKSGTGNLLVIVSALCKQARRLCYCWLVNWRNQMEQAFSRSWWMDS